MSSPLLDLHGAVGGDAPDHAVAAHYGAISAEQRRLAEGHTFVDLSHRDVVTITGPDRLSWLHSLTTQFLENLAPGVPTEVLLLSPQGRIEHGFSGVDDGETFWAHTEPGAGAALVGVPRPHAFHDAGRGRARHGRLGRHRPARSAVGDPARGHRWRDLPAELGDPVGLWAWEADAHRGRSRARSDSTPTTRRSPTRSGCSASRCTSTRAATADRRPSRGCTRWAARRAGSSGCSSTARSTTSRPTARTSCSTAYGSAVRRLVGPPPRARPHRACRDQAQRRPGRDAAGRRRRSQPGGARRPRGGTPRTTGPQLMSVAALRDPCGLHGQHLPVAR